MGSMIGFEAAATGSREKRYGTGIQTAQTKGKLLLI